MEFLISSLDEHLKYLSHEISETTITIGVESNQHTCTCPYCDTRSNKVHSTYTRVFQEVPIQEKYTFIRLRNKKYFCVNPEYSRNTFAERFDFIEDKSKKTKRAQKAILDVAMEMSSISASKYLKKHGILVGKSVICDMIKKTKIVIDKNSVTTVCIDDFALCKRKDYGTVMIDISTHKIIDMIASREPEKVSAWLNTYPNLLIVSRDGAASYRNAIKKANENIIQVSDRFHLIMNLSDYAKKALLSILPKRLAFKEFQADIQAPNNITEDDVSDRELKRLALRKEVCELHEKGM